MKPHFWIEKWQSGQIAFHQNEFEPLLVEYFPRAAIPGKVLVPLCGKSLDMIWLAQQGCEVIGVELSTLACEAFFTENFPEQEVQLENRDDFVVYRAGPFTLYCGDFFKLGSAELQGVSAVYDRAALIALPPELRQRYVAHLKSLLKPALLLITLEYPQERMEGPPFSLTEEEVRRLYGDAFEVERCITKDVSEDFQGSLKLQGAKILQHAFRMKPKTG